MRLAQGKEIDQGIHNDVISVCERAGFSQATYHVNALGSHVEGVRGNWRDEGEVSPCREKDSLTRI